MEWRLFGPLILAVVLFLLVGTIFERRIEAAIRRIIEHQQAHLLANRTNNRDTISIQSPSISSSQKTQEPESVMNYHSSSVPDLKTLKYTVSVLSVRKSFPQL